MLTIGRWVRRAAQSWLFQRRVRAVPGPPRATALAAVIEPGDIVLHREHGDLLGGLIAHFTASPYSHVEIYSGDGWSISAEGHGISYVEADRGGGAFVDVLRCPALGTARRPLVLAAAAETLGQPYEFALLAGFPYLSRRALVRRAANEAFICSEHVAWCYRRAGVTLVPERPQSAQAPADLAHSSQVRYVASFHRGRRLADAQLNQRHPLQGRRSRLAVALLRVLANPVSLRDEYYRALAARQTQTTRDSGVRPEAQ